MVGAVSSVERVRLRPVTMVDAEVLFDWANDPETRAASFSTDPIPWDTHVDWLRRVIADDGRRLWIALVDGPVGQVRLDREGPEEVISVAVAPSERGRGLATEIITAACREAAGTVVAHIRPGNERSLRAFTRAGFVEEDRSVDRTLMRWSQVPTN